MYRINGYPRLLGWLIRATLAFAFCFGALGQAQEPAAPTPFWTKGQIFAQSLNFTLRVIDTAQTCHHVSEGWREVWEPTQSCIGVAGWTMAGVPVSIGLSYLLHKRGHQRLALSVPYFSASGSGLAIGLAYWPRKVRNAP
jgi:hypothetical protein